MLSLLVISSSAAFVSAETATSYDVKIDGNPYLGIGQTGMYNVTVSSGAGAGAVYNYTAAVTSSASVTPSSGKTSSGTFSVNITAPSTAQDIKLWINVTATSSAGYSNGSNTFTIHVIKPIVLSATVKNSADVTAYSVPIEFWVDGTLISSSTFTAPANGTQVVTYNWTKSDIGNGQHTLLVKLDPNNQYVRMSDGSYESTSTFYVGDGGLGILSLVLTIVLVLLIVVVVLTWMGRGRKKKK